MTGLSLFMEDEKYLDPVFLQYGQKVYTYNHIEELRKKKSKKDIIPQKGGQEMLLTSEANIIFYGGVRGGGKSAGLLMNGYKYIENPHFLGSIFRKEINDAKRSGSIVDQSNFFYKDFGIYNKSSQDMTWNFSNGGKLNFGYYSDSFDGFTTRYRGMQIAYIGIDEVTQIPYTYFKFLLTCNRNAQGLENKIIGTCNPDPDSWVSRFIGGTYSNKIGEDGIEKCRYKWIGEDGYPIEDMNGKILYCYMWGDREDQVYWGETKEEVYEQAKDKIDAMWTPELEQFGNKLDMFIFSVTFIIGRLEENKILLESDPSYFKNLAQQSEEQRMRDLKGNWKFKSSGDGLITRDHLEAIFKNSQQRNDYRCVTADIAFDGGDLAVLFYWEGFHAMAVEVFKVNAQILLHNIQGFLEKYAIAEENFCYDATGLGKYLEGFMPKAIPFFTNASPTDKKEVQLGNVKQMISNYENLKAQCIDLCCDRIKLQGYSFDPLMLGRRILGKMLIDHLREEYVSFRRDNKNIDGKFKIMPKSDAIAIIGHSPNFIDALYIREYLEIIRTSKKITKRIGACFL